MEKRFDYSRLKAIRLPASANVKLLLVMFALAIVAGTLWFTQDLVNELRATERRSITLYANTLQALLSAPQDDFGSTDVTSDLALRAARAVQLPMIVTDSDGIPQYTVTLEGDTSFADWVRNVNYDTTVSSRAQLAYLSDRVETMQGQYDPLRIHSILPNDAGGYDSTLIHYIYFDDSRAVEQLTLLPYVEIIIVSMFILIGYISFSHIKKSEQSNIWVGMAKETAHQLGTPLSSLMGWIELLRLTPGDREQVLEAADEMDRDVERLSTVAQRFSKIGSATELRRMDLNRVITDVMTYFQRRLPHLGKRVLLEFDPSEAPLAVELNRDLFTWVLENLIRNAADAIDRNDGEIRFTTRKSRGFAIVEISDNGKGIDPKVRKDIFRPGFSTKKRGWGLGLSLAKRIVEEYHGGKITVKESSSRGTTFQIRLKLSDVAMSGESSRNGPDVEPTTAPSTVHQSSQR